MTTDSEHTASTSPTRTCSVNSLDRQAQTRPRQPHPPDLRRVTGRAALRLPATARKRSHLSMTPTSTSTSKTSCSARQNKLDVLYLMMDHPRQRRKCEQA